MNTDSAITFRCILFLFVIRSYFLLILNMKKSIAKWGQ